MQAGVRRAAGGLPEQTGSRGLTRTAPHPLATPPRPNRYSAPHASSSRHLDTHAFVKRLTQAGMPEDQAEVLANGQADLYERLVTKEYFQFTLKHELEKLRAELKNDIARVQANLEQVKAELKHDIETVKVELKHELDQHKVANKQALKELELTLKHELEQHKAELKHELETNRTKLKRDIKEMEQKLTIKLGAIVVIGITVLSVLDKLF